MSPKQSTPLNTSESDDVERLKEKAELWDYYEKFVIQHGANSITDLVVQRDKLRGQVDELRRAASQPREDFLPVWRETGPSEDPASSLIAEIVIAGVSHHMEAIAVTSKESVQEAVDPEVELNDYSAVFGGDGAFHTVAINARDYVLFLSPHRQ